MHGAAPHCFFLCQVDPFAGKEECVRDTQSFACCWMEHKNTVTACCFLLMPKGKGRSGASLVIFFWCPSFRYHSQQWCKTNLCGLLNVFPHATAPDSFSCSPRHGDMAAPRPHMLLFWCRRWCNLLPVLLFKGVSLASHSWCSTLQANSVCLVKTKYFRHGEICWDWREEEAKGRTCSHMSMMNVLLHPVASPLSELAKLPIFLFLTRIPSFIIMLLLRVTESQTGWGWQGPLGPPTASAGLARAECPSPHDKQWASSWVSAFQGASGLDWLNA